MLLAYCLLNVVAFAVLVIASHWSPSAFKLLFARRMRWFGLYYEPVLLWVWPLKVWVLNPYFRSLQGEFDSDHLYLDQLIKLADKSTLPGSGLLDLFHGDKKQIAWLQGEPGTGKTEMVAEFMRRYLAAPYLWIASTAYAFIPVVVRMREVESRSFEKYVRDVMESHGMVFDDQGLFGRFLRSGGFLVILDGLNEASVDEKVRDGLVLSFAKSARRVKFLATSQTLPPCDSRSLELYRLPPTTPELARELIVAFLGEAKGRAAIADTPKSLWGEIGSAYDVRLVADLVSRSVSLPENRLGLYQAALDLAAMAWNGRGAFPEDLICRVAWETWIAQSGWLFTGERLGRTYCDH